MPRKNPLPQREAEICERLTSYRRFVRLSRAAFAATCRVDSEVISRIEHKRSPLRWSVFTRISHVFPINPKWLATGNGGISAALPTSGTREIKSDAGALFSQVYDDLLGPDIEQALLAERETVSVGDCYFKTEVDNSPEGRADALEVLQDLLQEWLSRVSDDELQTFLSQLTAHGEELVAASSKRETVDSVTERHAQIGRVMTERLLREPVCKGSLEVSGGNVVYEVKARLRLNKPPGSHNGVEESQNQDLTYPSGQDRTPGDVKIKPQWPELKKRLQKATEAIGTKPALASVLGVDPTQISQWLSESKSAREPGGDYALRLLKWVEQRERQKQ